MNEVVSYEGSIFSIAEVRKSNFGGVFINKTIKGNEKISWF